MPRIAAWVVAGLVSCARATPQQTVDAQEHDLSTPMVPNLNLACGAL
jgi:hypothetical protein